MFRAGTSAGSTAGRRKSGRRGATRGCSRPVWPASHQRWTSTPAAARSSRRWRGCPPGWSSPKAGLRTSSGLAAFSRRAVSRSFPSSPDSSCPFLTAASNSSQVATRWPPTGLSLPGCSSMAGRTWLSTWGRTRRTSSSSTSSVPCRRGCTSVIQSVRPRRHVARDWRSWTFAPRDAGWSSSTSAPSSTCCASASGGSPTSRWSDTGTCSSGSTRTLIEARRKRGGVGQESEV
jgi:hypothetical protein